MCERILWVVKHCAYLMSCWDILRSLFALRRNTYTLNGLSLPMTLRSFWKVKLFMWVRDLQTLTGKSIWAVALQSWKLGTQWSLLSRLDYITLDRWLLLISWIGTVDNGVCFRFGEEATDGQLFGPGYPLSRDLPLHLTLLMAKQLTQDTQPLF